MTAFRVRRVAGILLIAALALTLRWVAGSRGADNIDSIYFARALDRYAVAELRPYFPGFPIYVWAGRAARILVPDRLEALHLVSGLASLLTAWPLALLAAAWRRAAGGLPAEVEASAWTAAVLWSVMPLACVTGTEISSDPLALLMGTAMLVGCTRLVETGRARWAVFAGAAAGVMLGVRLLHVFVMAPLLPVARGSWRRGVRHAALGMAAGFAAGVLPWLAWQLAQDGRGLLTTGMRTVRSHVGTQDFTVVGDPEALGRPGRFLSMAYAQAFGGWTPGSHSARVVLVVALLALVVIGVRRFRGAPPSMRWLPVLFVAPHAVYVTLGQDVGYHRYAFPLAAMAVAVAGTGVPRGRSGVALVGAAGLASALATLDVARAHRTTEPVEFQLARYLHQAEPAGAALVLTDGGTLIPTILQEFAPKVMAVPGSATVLAATRTGPGRRVYALEPSPDRPEDWVPAARFCRKTVFDHRSPAELWLFRYAPGEAAGAVPACASP